MSEATAALAVMEKEKSVGTLFRQATDVAGVCGAIVKQTAQRIGDRKYVKVEGWQSIAVTYGCIASSRDVERVAGGYRAIGEVKRVSDGAVLATAEGFVGEDEPMWFGGIDEKGKKHAGRPQYAIRAMAQTRAISRACRSAFAFVVTLIDASLSTTPAEEVPEGGFTDNFTSAAATEKAAAVKQRLASQQTVDAPRASPPRSGGLTFPNYGKAKGQPVAGASKDDLIFYRKGAERTLADPGKAKWHDREKALIDAIDAELRRQSAGTDAPPPEAVEASEPPPHGDADAPF